MNELDKMKNLWSSQNANNLFSIDQVQLLKIVMKKSNRLALIVALRDFLETFCTFLLIPFVAILIFYILPKKVGGPPSDYYILGLFILPIIYGGSSFLRARISEAKKNIQFKNTIRGEIEKAIYNINRQIYINKNVGLQNILPESYGIFPALYFVSELQLLSAEKIFPFSVWIVSGILIFFFIFAQYIYNLLIKIRLNPQKEYYQNLLYEIDTAET